MPLHILLGIIVQYMVIYVYMYTIPLVAALHPT